MRMLICPKHIYNLCLLHACFVSLCHVFLELSYTFDHIWTNLLTQCTQLPVLVFCSFCISGFPVIKSAQKIPENLYKISIPEASGMTKTWQQGHHQGPMRVP